MVASRRPLGPPVSGVSRETPPGLRELCGRHGLGPDQERQLLLLLRGLTKPSAPTAVHEPDRILRAHLADSLAALGLVAALESKVVVDIGAGAGLPGLPLAIALPAGDFRLLESQRRKCAFIEGMSREAGIENARVVDERAESWTAGLNAHDLALARALAPQSVVLEYAAPLLEIGGTLLDWRGRRAAEEERSAALAAGELGMRLRAIHHTEPYDGARDHHVHEYEKVSPTPSRFPRRPGVARRRPLGC